MSTSRCLIIRNPAGVTELVPLDRIVHVEFTEAKPNVPHAFEERIVLRLSDGEPLTYSGLEATAIWRQLLSHFNAGSVLEADGSTSTPSWR